jgi:hypothetical protein
MSAAYLVVYEIEPEDPEVFLRYYIENAIKAAGRSSVQVRSSGIRQAPLPGS